MADDDMSAPMERTGNAVLDAARGIAASVMPMGVGTVTGAEEETATNNTEWTRVELFVIASLQLVLVLVAYRLDRQKHPALISESAWAMFFGVMVGGSFSNEGCFVVLILIMNIASVDRNSLAPRSASFPPWFVRFLDGVCSGNVLTERLLVTGIAQQWTEP